MNLILSWGGKLNESVVSASSIIIDGLTDKKKGSLSSQNVCFGVQRSDVEEFE